MDLLFERGERSFQLNQIVAFVNHPYKDEADFGVIVDYLGDGVYEIDQLVSINHTSLKISGDVIGEVAQRYQANEFLRRSILLSKMQREEEEEFFTIRSDYIFDTYVKALEFLVEEDRKKEKIRSLSEEEYTEHLYENLLRRRVLPEDHERLWVLFHQLEDREILSFRLFNGVLQYRKDGFNEWSDLSSVLLNPPQSAQILPYSPETKYRVGYKRWDNYDSASECVIYTGNPLDIVSDLNHQLYEIIVFNREKNYDEEWKYLKIGLYGDLKKHFEVESKGYFETVNGKLSFCDISFNKRERLVLDCGGLEVWYIGKTKRSQSELLEDGRKKLEKLISKEWFDLYFKNLF